MGRVRESRGEVRIKRGNLTPPITLQLSMNEEVKFVKIDPEPFRDLKYEVNVKVSGLKPREEKCYCWICGG